MNIISCMPFMTLVWKCRSATWPLLKPCFAGVNVRNVVWRAMKKGYRENCSRQLWKCDKHPSILPKISKDSKCICPSPRCAPPSSFASLLSPCARFPPLPSAAFPPTLWPSSFPPVKPEKTGDLQRRFVVPRCRRTRSHRLLSFGYLLLFHTLLGQIGIAETQVWQLRIKKNSFFV